MTNRGRHTHSDRVPLQFWVDRSARQDLKAFLAGNGRTLQSFLEEFVEQVLRDAYQSTPRHHQA